MDIENEHKVSKLNVCDKTIDYSDVIQWAEKWDWGVGEIVAKRLCKRSFKDEDSAIVLTINEKLAGFCLLEKTDSWGTDLDDTLTPFITAMYIDPQYRGQKLSKILIEAACNAAYSFSFNAVYLISSQQGYYEKFGFEIFAQTVTQLGETEPVFRKYL